MKNILAALLIAAVSSAFAAEDHATGIVREILANVAKIKAADPDAVPMAFWDFDGTVIKGDVTDGLVEDGAVRYAGLAERSVRAGFCPMYEASDAGVWQFRTDYTRFREIGRWFAWPYLAQMLIGADVEKVDRFCAEGYRETFAQWYFSSSVMMMEALEKAGVENYVISGSPEIFVRNAAETLHLPRNRFRGIRVEEFGGRVTERVIQPVPANEGKIENVRGFVLSRPHGVAVAGFGNSYWTDGPFLRYIATQPALPGGAKGFAVMINGGKAVGGYTEFFRCVDQTETCGCPTKR